MTLLPGAGHLPAVGFQVSRPPSPLLACPQHPGLPHMLGGRPTPQPHEKPFPQGVPTPGKTGSLPSTGPAQWLEHRARSMKPGWAPSAATLFQSGLGAFRYRPLPAPPRSCPAAQASSPVTPEERCPWPDSTLASACLDLGS